MVTKAAGFESPKIENFNSSPNMSIWQNGVDEFPTET